jgi:hypothetical protein
MFVELKDAFRPEWKKLVIPIILLVIYAILVNHFYQFGSLEDKYVCQLASLNEDYVVYRLSNQTSVLGYNNTVEKLGNLRSEIGDEISRISVPNVLFLIVETVDPLIPAPCESANQTGAYVCKYYSSKETQDCLADIAVFMNGGNATGVEQSSRPAYEKVSYFDVGFNSILIFLEGYIISCLLALGYKLSKRRIQSARAIR